MKCFLLRLKPSPSMRGKSREKREKLKNPAYFNALTVNHLPVSYPSLCCPPFPGAFFPVHVRAKLKQSWSSTLTFLPSLSFLAGGVCAPNSPLSPFFRSAPADPWGPVFPGLPWSPLAQSRLSRPGAPGEPGMPCIPGMPFVPSCPP